MEEVVMSKEVINEELILKALSNVNDPDLGRDIVSLGFIKNLKIENTNVSFNLELTTPACPVKDKLKAECEENIKKLPGVGKIAVNLTSRVKRGASYNLANLNGVKNIFRHPVLAE